MKKFDWMPNNIQKEKILRFLEWHGPHLNSIQSRSTTVCLQNEAVVLWMKEILCNQLI